MNTAPVPYVIKTNGAVTMYLNNESVTVAQDHPNYNSIIEVLKKGRFDLIDGLVNIAKAVKVYTEASAPSGAVKINDGLVTYNGFALSNTLTVRILKMMNEGFKFDHMVRFLENLMLNPSYRATNELYTFLENRGLPITDDGHFLAYKAVRQDYFDIFTGHTHKNLVGTTQEMARNLVNEDWGIDCAQGLHCGAMEYVTDYGHFVQGHIVPNQGNRLIIVKVNPRDVVCVPNYAKFSKMRVCKYVVLSEIQDVATELGKSVYSVKGNTVTELKPDVAKTSSSPVLTEYQNGYSAGETDRENDFAYGKSRLSAVGDYLKGYNDAYNGRPNKAPVSQTTMTKSGRKIQWDGTDVEAYRDGFIEGSLDYDNCDSYGTTRDYDRNTSYLCGYNDAYNGRQDQTANLPPSSVEPCSCSCGCSQSVPTDDKVEDTDEYEAGFDLGFEDKENGEDYQSSLDIDSIDSFKQGYRDGFNEAEVQA